MKYKIERIYKQLLERYGKQGWWPVFNNKNKIEYHKNNYDIPLNEQQRFEISIGAILTQNATWKSVEISLKKLKDSNLLNPKLIIKTKDETIAELIKSSIYHNQKTKKLRIFSEWIETQPNITRETLLNLWGVGNETADSILLYAYKKPIFVIDTYTKRIFSRIGLINEKMKYEEIQKIFMNNLERDYKLFNEYHALIVEHAKRYCKTKPQCDNCPLNDICEYTKQYKIKL